MKTAFNDHTSKSFFNVSRTLYELMEEFECPLSRVQVEDPIREDGQICKPQDFPLVTELRLSHKNIIEISNLELFESLTTLRLDNNIIQKVHGLDNLKNLTWLDLSFNNLKDMNGLDALVNLKDLVLADNQIDTIAHCKCTKLQVISLARNNITNLDEVNHLRQFPHLRDAAFAGNPIADNHNYKMHVLTYIPQLQFLDHKTVILSEEEKSAIENYHADDITDIRDAESKKRADKAAEEAVEQQRLALEKGFLGATFHLPELLLNPLLEPAHIEDICKEYPVLRANFHDGVCERVSQLAKTFAPLNEQRNAKVRAFERAVEDVVARSDKESTRIVADLKRQKKDVLDQIYALGPGEVYHKEVLARPFYARMTNSKYKILQVEIELKQTLKQALQVFQDEMTTLCGILLTYSSNFWGANGLEHLVKKFHSDLHDITKDNLDSYMQGLHTDDAFSKEEFQIAVQNFEECHTNLVDEKGTQMDADINMWKKEYFNSKQKMLHDRRCSRVDEITVMTNNLRGEIEALIAQAEEDENLII